MGRELMQGASKDRASIARKSKIEHNESQIGHKENKARHEEIKAQHKEFQIRLPYFSKA
jgi:hypothetical protein